MEIFSLIQSSEYSPWTYDQISSTKQTHRLPDDILCVPCVIFLPDIFDFSVINQATKEYFLLLVAQYALQVIA
jgi:hypothetical protein